MGTNFYVQDKPCPHCGRTDERIHVGKSTAGWCFSLAVHPDLGINTLNDWQVYWADREIVNEYGDKLSSEDMLAWITERSWERKGPPRSQAYLDMNNAEEGPKGLMRHVVGGFCIGHGDGTFDYIAREFS